MNSEDNESIEDVSHGFENFPILDRGFESDSDHNSIEFNESDSLNEFQTSFNTSDDYVPDVDKNIHIEFNTTVESMMFKVLSYYVRHNLTWVALEDMLSLLNTIFGQQILPQSKYLFKKFFPKGFNPIIHHFCENCGLYIDEKESATTTKNCSNCEAVVSLNTSGKNYFITLPLKPQLSDVLERNADYLKLHHNSESCSIHDVFDGKLYKNLVSKNPTKNLITLVLNTDGARIHKSPKKCSLWPIQMVINELDEHVRFKEENLIVTGFWYGGDPDMNIFLNPLIKELKELDANNFEINVPNFQNAFVSPLILTLDTVAKDLIQNKVPFNAYNGCSYCHHPGVIALKTQIRYPYIEGIQKRTHLETLDDMRTAYILDEVTRGFKGLSVVVAMPNIDIVSAYCIDYMHCVLLGVVRRLLDLWLDSSSHSKDYYIGIKAKVMSVNKRLLSIKPNKTFSRVPRSITERHTWKANELRTWLLYYGVPCLDGILPKKYQRHFILLSDSIFILSTSNITPCNIDTARNKLLEFVLNFERFYGIENMVYNVHLLTHLIDCVENCGPLWAHSNFCFESNNGVLVDYVKGNTDQLQQIVSKYCFKRTIANMLCHQNELDQHYYKSINRKYRETEDTVIKFLGGPSLIVPNNDIKNSLVIENINIDVISAYNRISIGKTVYHSLHYDEKLKTKDSIVELLDGSYGEIEFMFSHQNKYYMVLNKTFEANNRTEFCLHMNPLYRTETPFCQVVELSQIKTKCLYLDTISSITISRLPNKLEYD